MEITIYCPSAESVEYQIGQHDTPGMIGPEWTGDVDSALIGVDYDGETPIIAPTTLERLFRVFNRVDEHDGPRLEAMGYKLPSLSSGDVVTIEGKHWLCASMGWKELTPEQYADFKAQCHANPRDAWSIAFRLGRES